MNHPVFIKICDFVKWHAPILLVCLAVITCVIAVPSLFAFRHLRNVLYASATPVILACGLSVCFAGGYLDFAAVRNLMFGAVLSGVLLQASDAPDKVFRSLPELPVIVPLFLVIILCAGLAVLPILISVRFRVPPILSSILFGGGFQGCTVLLAAGFTGTPGVITDFTNSYTTFATAYIGVDQVYSIPWVVVIALLVVAGCWYFVKRSKIGISLGYSSPGLSGRYDLPFAGDSNDKLTEEGKRNLRFLAFSLIPVALISGALYGLAGFIFTACNGAVSASYETDLWLSVFCGCLIGGISVFGGRGASPRASFGVFMCLTFEYVFDFLNVPIGITRVCIVTLAVAALCLDIAQRREQMSRVFSSNQGNTDADGLLSPVTISNDVVQESTSVTAETEEISLEAPAENMPVDSGTGEKSLSQKKAEGSKWNLGGDFFDTSSSD